MSPPADYEPEESSQDEAGVRCDCCVRPEVLHEAGVGVEGCVDPEDEPPGGAACHPDDEPFLACPDESFQVASHIFFRGRERGVPQGPWLSTRRVRL
jgi:hypothetical protein